MPKQIKELKIFKEGLISNASSLDMPSEAAAYSENIDPNIEGGTLGGSASDNILTQSGFGVGSTRQFYLDIHKSWDNAKISDDNRRDNWHQDGGGWPDNTYFIIETESRLRNFAVSINTDYNTSTETPRDISSHTLMVGNTETPLIDFCPDVNGTTVTTIPIQLGFSVLMIKNAIKNSEFANTGSDWTDYSPFTTITITDDSSAYISVTGTNSTSPEGIQLASDEMQAMVVGDSYTIEAEMWWDDGSSPSIGSVHYFEMGGAKSSAFAVNATSAGTTYTRTITVVDATKPLKIYKEGVTNEKLNIDKVIVTKLSGSHWSVANFRKDVVEKFVTNWNAAQVQITSTTLKTLGDVIKATSDTSGSNRRVILTPQVFEADNITYHQYGDSVNIPILATDPVGSWGEQKDQIVEVKNETQEENWSSPGSDAGYTTFKSEGDHTGGIFAPLYTLKIEGLPTIEDGFYSAVDIDTSNFYFEFEMTTSSDDLYGADAADESVLVNGDFESASNTSSVDGIEGWTSVGTHNEPALKWVIGVAGGSNTVTLTDNNSFTNTGIVNENVLEIGKYYKYSINITSWTATGGELIFSTPSDIQNSIQFATPVENDAGDEIKFTSAGVKTGIFKATSTNFCMSRKDTESTYSVEFKDLYITPANGTVYIATNTPPFDVSLGAEGKGLVVEASDITTIYDGEKTDLIAFDKLNNNINVVQDIDNEADSLNSVETVKSGITHDNTSQFVKFNKEFRLGLGSGSASKPLWGGFIDRNQLDRNLDGFYVENQELTPSYDDLAGYNFDKFIVPYLPPADEMGKRWYQSQLIDMSIDMTNAGGSITESANSSEIPAYQCTLGTNNLGNVTLASVDTDAKLLNCFDCGGGSSDNYITGALNNAANGTNDKYAKPFTGLTFVVGTIPTSNGKDRMETAKRKYWYNAATVVAGDVYMVTKLSYDGDECNDVEFLYMGSKF